MAFACESRPWLCRVAPLTLSGLGVRLRGKSWPFEMHGGAVASPPLLSCPFASLSLKVAIEDLDTGTCWSTLRYLYMCQNMFSCSRINLIEVVFCLGSNTSPLRDRFDLVSWAQSLFSGDGRTLPVITGWSGPGGFVMCSLGCVTFYCMTFGFSMRFYGL